MHALFWADSLCRGLLYFCMVGMGVRAHFHSKRGAEGTIGFFFCLFVLRKAISSMPKTGIVEKTEGHGGNRKMDVLESDRRHRLSCPISSLSLVSTVRNWDQVMMTN